MFIKLPIGYSDFRKVIDRKLNFVDKTLFIREILDDETEVTVITRPRRFGKTFNLSMLHHFLASIVHGQSTQGIFENLKLAKTSPQHMDHQGKYPVVFLTLKDVKDHCFEDAYASLCEMIRRLYNEHYYLLEDPNSPLRESEKELYNVILRKQGGKEDIITALRNITEYLHRYHGVKPWLLVDEYDTPIQSSFLQGYYDEMIGFMRNFFGTVLKDNPYLEKSVITGILRVSKESLFSGVNNLKTYSVLHQKYSQYFGFTEQEVGGLLQKALLDTDSEEVKNWYNGYQIGQTIIYNPWSIVNYIYEKGELQPYWINTSDNQLIRNLVVDSSENFKIQINNLLQDQPIEKTIDENVVFGDLQRNETAIWSLFLMTGYLKVVAQKRTDQGVLCQLAIPNREVRNLYRQIIEQWLANGHGIEWFNQFIDRLLKADISGFERDLRHLLERTVSVHDTSHDPEAYYHGLMVGFTANLCYNPNYELSSNRESGYGFYDYFIDSKDPNRPSIILEFKRVEAHSDLTILEQRLEKMAQEALDQISKSYYFAEAQRRGRQNILQIGLAFCGKRFKLCYKWELF